MGFQNLSSSKDDTAKKQSTKYNIKLEMVLNFNITRRIITFTSLTLLLIVLVSCNNEKSIKPKIEDQINKQCKQTECVFNLKDITQFKWQKMYFFKNGISLETIDSSLGFHYPYFEDIAERIIFVQDNKVIYHEDDFINPEAERKSGVIFEIPDSIPFYIIDSRNAKFNVKIETFKRHKYYELTPVDYTAGLY